ncbi:MAG: hypothetical protein GXC76_10005 [Rhodanobacteraceae bacterium]|jgi:hypothetical protein|nr:hypothetical protein [Rhodanobacteraceae bacterium]
MRKILPAFALACCATFALSACNQSEQQPKQEQAEQAPVVLPKPTDATDKAAWKKYLVSVVTANMEGVKSNRPYMYYVPGGDDDTAKSDRANQLDNVKNVVDRGVLPGNMMAFGGPDSKITAELIVNAFKDVQPNAFKDVRVLYIGDAADAETVKQALAASGADVRFVEAK